MKADTPKKYRLVGLVAQNVKKLRAVALKIDGSMFKVFGKNEQGKSSLLDAVAIAIGGPSAFPEEPIRKGEDKAEIVLDFGDLKLTRKIWRKEGGKFGQSLELDFADGKRPREKQTVLDALRGSPIADDPIAFTRLKAKERYDLLRQLVPNFDFAANKEERRELFEERTQVGREFDRAKGAAESIVVPLNAPLEAVDVSALAARLTEVIQANAIIDRRAANREQAADELETKRDRADRMKVDLKVLEGEIATLQKTIDTAEALPVKADTEALNAQIREAETNNGNARRRAERVAKDAEAAALETKYESLTQRIAESDKQKATAIEGAKLPVPELAFGDDDIILDGLPFDQASTARKIRVSTALLMALKPELRVLLVREGSLLDDEARAALEADAVANDFVVLMECVGAGDGTGIVIENGEVR